MRATRIAVLFLIGALLVTASACNGSPKPVVPETAIDLVPADANFVVGLKPHDILTDADIVEFIDGATGDLTGYSMYGELTTLDDMMELVEGFIGVDPRDITEVIVFGDREWADYDIGGILKGPFNKEVIVSRLEELSGFAAATSTYKGYEIQTFDPVSLCFLDGGTVVVGMEGAVRDVISVAAGDEDALSGRLHDTYASLDDMWLQGAVELPFGGLELDELQEEDESLPDLHIFDEAEVAGAGFDKVGDTLTMEGKIYFSDASSAGEAETVLKALLILAGSGVLDEVPPGVEDLLDMLSISSDGRWLTVSMETTIDQMQELYDEMQEWSGSSTGGAEETAYTAERQQIEAAVAEFMTRPSDPSYHHTIGDVPVLSYDAVEVNGSEVIPGKDYYAIAMCPLLIDSHPKGILKDAPPSAHPDNCVCEGANAEPGVADCRADCTGSYIWLVNDWGYVASVCFDAGCDAGNEDGFQGVYP